MADEGLLHSRCLVYRGDECDVMLYKTRLLWTCIAHPNRKGKAVFSSTFGAVLLHKKKGYGFKVIAMSNGKKIDIEFACTSQEDAELFTNRIRELQKLTWHGSTERKPIFVLVNPYSGKKKAVELFKKEIEPLFFCAGVTFVMEETQRPGHATDIASKLELSEFSAVTTVSGDGLLHEVLQGLMKRNDWEEKKVPLSLLPAGTGNGLMKSFDTEGIHAGVFNLIKGYSIPLDIVKYSSSSDHIFSHLAMFWGLLADADIESDKYRWLGPARFTVGGIVRIVSLRSYRGVIRFLPASVHQPISSKILEESIDINTCPEGWEQVESEFVLLCVANLGWLSSDLCIAPKACHNDGLVDLVWVERENLKKSELASLMIAAETGLHINHPAVHYKKIRAFSIIPKDIGIIDIDGEEVSSVPMSAEILPAAVNLIVPPTFQNKEK